MTAVNLLYLPYEMKNRKKLVAMPCNALLVNSSLFNKQVRGGKAVVYFVYVCGMNSLTVLDVYDCCKSPLLTIWNEKQKETSGDALQRALGKLQLVEQASQGW